MFNLQKLIGHKYAPYQVTPTAKDLALYALGIGYQQNPLNLSHLKFTYEQHPQFQAVPIHPLVLTHRVDITKFPGIPDFDPLMLVHGEEHITVNNQVQCGTTYTVEEEIVDLQQKGGSGSLLVMRSKVFSPLSDLVASIRTGFFIRGLKGHDHAGLGVEVCGKLPKEPPNRAADIKQEELTTQNQAFIYRLSNDLNPLHVDPTRQTGFDRPILHGLCTFGIAARALQDNEFIESPMRLREMGTRFTGHVFPGETLIMEAWREPDQLYFQMTVKERNTVCLKGFAKLLNKPLSSKCAF